MIFHRQFPEIKISASLLQRTYKKSGVRFKYINKVKKVIDFRVTHYHDYFVKMYRQLELVKLYEMKLVLLDESIFSFNTFNAKAWSLPYNGITVPEDSLRVKT